MQLPDQPYDGENPDAFDSRDEIVGFLERYAARFEVPVHEGVAVGSLQPREAGGFLLETSAGPVEARAVVLATGAFQRPTRLPSGSTLPADLLRLDVGDYRNPAALPRPVLVVGSGAQLLELFRTFAAEERDSAAEPASRLGSTTRETLDLKGFAAVVRADRPDYESWVRIPGAFDGSAFRSMTTAPAPSRRISTSSAFTSFASESPRSSWEWARTLPSSRARSPGQRPAPRKRGLECAWPILLSLGRQRARLREHCQTTLRVVSSNSKRLDRASPSSQPLWFATAWEGGGLLVTPRLGRRRGGSA